MEKINNKKFFTFHFSLFTFFVGRQKGFTLLEIIITLAILAIISTIGFSYLGGYKTASELDETANQIVGKLREAQGKAMSGEDNKKWGIHFDNAGAEPFYELFSTTNNYATGSIIAEKIYLSHLAQGVIFTAPSSGQTIDVIFSKITGAPVGAQDIVIDLQGGARTISVETSGRVRIQ